MNKIKKYLFLFITLLLIGNNVVYADTNDHIVDFSRKGKFEVTLKDFDETNRIEGAEISLFHVASVSSQNNRLVYEFTEDFTECDADLSDLTKEGLTDDIKQCITEDMEPVQKQITDSEGVAVFEELELGLYLVKQTNKVVGYSQIDPFLINFPKEVDNKWTYEIEAEPKTDIIRLMDVIVEKKWDIQNSKSTPESVIIELLKGQEVIDEVVLNNENQWTHTWSQIEESDEYSVREKVVPTGYTVTYRQEGNKFIVTNIRTLVDTGQNYLVWLLLGTIGLGLVIFGVIYDKKSKYE